MPLIFGVILAILSSSGWALAPASQPGAAVTPGSTGQTVNSTRLITRTLARTVLIRTVLVHSGDTLSAIAAKHCGNPRDWTGIYLASKRVIGADPNMIRPGQLVVLHCTAPHWSAPATASYGSDREPDGDSDDAAAHSPSGYTQTAVSYSSGTYSYSGLEALWVSAGGPSWAQAHAAEIAECESGGRANAYNPSGATGLWQILGQVVGGNLWNPYVNALNAVAKFTASGDTFAQWVCT